MSINVKKYLAKFESTSAYNTFAASDDYVEPNVSLIVENNANTIMYNPIHDYSQDYLTFEVLDSSTFKFTNLINYSIDNGETWVVLSANTNSPTVQAGNKIMWKAALTPTSSNGIGSFTSTGRFTAQGNVMSLLYGDNFIGQVDLTGKDYAFKMLFIGCTNLTSAENMSLPATTLATSCYNMMFNGCISLIAPPELPATALADFCYQYMFNGCKLLTTAPELPVTTLAGGCYNNMFSGCISLTDAPELPATTLANYCYRDMFNGCTSLTTAPELPATTLADGCYYYMFNSCTSLTTAPELPAATLTKYCYGSMFIGCTNLNSITMLATNISASGCLTNWVNGVSASGTFTKAPSMISLSSGVNGIPEGWTVQDYIAA